MKLSAATTTAEPAVLFIHGFLDSAAVWNDVVAALRGRDAEFIRVDLAGMGDRADEKGPYSLDRFVADVTVVVAASAKPVVLVGQNMGAQVAELVAAGSPGQVAGLVLLTPVPLAGAGLPDEAIAPFRSLGAQPEAQRACGSSCRPTSPGRRSSAWDPSATASSPRWSPPRRMPGIAATPMARCRASIRARCSSSAARTTPS